MIRRMWPRRALVIALAPPTLFNALVRAPLRFLFRESLPDWLEGIRAAWWPPQGASQAEQASPLAQGQAGTPRQPLALPEGYGRILNPWPTWEAVGRLVKKAEADPAAFSGAPAELLEILEIYKRG